LECRAKKSRFEMTIASFLQARTLSGLGNRRPPQIARTKPPARLVIAQREEDVRLFRDDAAEVVWAVEETAPDASGYPPPGYERGKTAQSSLRLPILHYQLQTPVPPAWYPFLPKESGGSLVDFVAATIPDSSNQPWGRIVPSLQASGSAGIPEQAIPRAGLRLQRIYCRTRWNDGATYLWIARGRQLGSRGPASGLKYDFVQLGSS